MSRDRLTTRFLIVGGALALLLALVCVALVVAVLQLRDSSHDATSSAQRLFNASRAQRLTVDQETGLRGYLLTHGPALLEPARAARGARLDAGDAAAAERGGGRPGGARTPGRGGRAGLHPLRRRGDRGRA